MLPGEGILDFVVDTRNLPRARGGVTYEGDLNDWHRRWQFNGGRQDGQFYGDRVPGHIFACDICGLTVRGSLVLRRHRQQLHGC